MSVNSEATTPRANKLLVISLVLLGLALFVGVVFGLMAQGEGNGPDRLRAQVSKFNEKIRNNSTQDQKIPAQQKERTQTASADSVKGVTDEEIGEDEANRDISEVNAQIVEGQEPVPEDKLITLDIPISQNNVDITLTDVEMTEKLLIATFRILNNSKHTVYFSFYGTNASYDDNGGSMYRDLDSEKDADYDQIPTVINSGEEVVGRIAYTPLIYYDKPFTIYISGVKFREVEADWSDYRFFVDPNQF